MRKLAARMFDPEVRRYWAYGLGLTVVAAAILVLPPAMRLRRSVKELATIHRTYADKLSWAGHRGALEDRVREQEQAVAELDVVLLTAQGVGGLTRSIASAARASRCSIRSIRPAEPRFLPHPDTKGPKGGAEAGRDEQRTQFLEWPIHIAVQGDYASICALLRRLESGDRLLRLKRLKLGPGAEDPKHLSCTVELAGYGLRAAGGGK